MKFLKQLFKQELVINKGKKRMIYVGLAVLILFMTVAFWNKPVIRNYELTTDKLDQDQSFRLVQLSDLHSAYYGSHQKILMEKIKKAEPDGIVLTGDIIDDIEEPDGAYELVELLVEDYPVYYVSGNHEWWHKYTSQLIEALESRGVILLEDAKEIVELNGVTVVMSGVFDPDKFGREPEASVMERSLEEVDFYSIDNIESYYTILLAHRPELYESYNKYPIDLVFSGHAHGGQVRIPFLLNGLYAPNQGLFPERAGGLYQDMNYDHIVSRGLSKNWKLPRVFNPPEVVVVDVKGI